MEPYEYGKSIIKSKLKYDFKDNNVKYAKIKGEFMVELKIYCGRKKMYEAKKTFNNATINYAIQDIFDKHVEKQTTFHKGHNYYATFKAYELKPIRRAKYIKTDTYINSNRRKYLLQERINIYF